MNQSFGNDTASSPHHRGSGVPSARLFHFLPKVVHPDFEAFAVPTYSAQMHIGVAHFDIHKLKNMGSTPLHELLLPLQQRHLQFPQQLPPW